MCTECEPGYRLEGTSECYPCFVSHCAKCQGNVGVCEECFAGYRLDGKVCQQCAVMHCSKCPNAAQECTECLNGYTLKSGNCIPNVMKLMAE